MKIKIITPLLMYFFIFQQVRGDIHYPCYFSSMLLSSQTSSQNIKSCISAKYSFARWNFLFNAKRQEESTDNIKIENLKKNIQRLRGKSAAYIIGGVGGTPLGIMMYIYGTKQPHSYDLYGQEELNFLEFMGGMTCLVSIAFIVFGFNLQKKANELSKELNALEKEKKSINLNFGIRENSLALTINYQY